MRSQRLIVTIVLTVFFCIPVYLISYEGGPPARRTGGPFPGERVCAITDCHVGIPPNSGPGSVRITINGLVADQYRYAAGETVPVTVHVEDPTKVRWGFELTARTEGGCGQAGTFATSPAENQVQIFKTGPMDVVPECPPDQLQLPMHLFPKATAGGGTFEFTWTAPASDIGPITFAAAGNAANGDRDHTGDSIYTTSAVIQPTPTAPAPTPSIGSGGVVVATGTPLVAGASANAILSLFGQEIAPAGTSALSPATDIEGNVATRLANTCVEISGTRAPLFAVLPTQINLQAPSNPGLGPVPVVVIRDCGLGSESRSAPEMVNMAAVSPAFFNFVNNGDGVNPIAVVHQNGVDLVGPPGLFGGAVATTPAAPGEFVSLYATGLGPTNPAFVAGQIPQNTANQTASITGSLAVKIGEIQVSAPSPDIFYAGVAPCCAGLYQLVVKVPDNAPDGNLPVVMTVNGVSSPEGPFVAVQRP